LGKIKRRHVKSKLAVSFLLLETPATAVYVPDTRLLYKNSLYEMLEAYAEVYIKPDKGVQGIGIMRVEKEKDGHFVIRSNWYTVLCKDFDTLWSVLYKLTDYSRHIIQKAIRSGTINGDPFDLRVHVFRIGGTWKASVMYARVDSSDKVTTNVKQGGKSVLMDTLFQEHLRYDNVLQKKMLEEITKCAETIAATVQGMYPTFYEYGIDIGIDKKQRLWVYEVNISPMSPDEIIEGDGSAYTQYWKIKNLSS